MFILNCFITFASLLVLDKLAWTTMVAIHSDLTVLNIPWFLLLPFLPHCSFTWLPTHVIFPFICCWLCYFFPCDLFSYERKYWNDLLNVFRFLALSNLKFITCIDPFHELKSKREKKKEVRGFENCAIISDLSCLIVVSPFVKTIWWLSVVSGRYLWLGGGCEIMTYWSEIKFFVCSVWWCRQSFVCLLYCFLLFSLLSSYDIACLDLSLCMGNSGSVVTLDMLTYGGSRMKTATFCS